MSPKPLLLALALLLLSLPAMAQTDQPEDVFPANLFPSKAASPLSVGLFGGYTSNTHVIDVLYATDMKYTPAPGFTAGATGSLHLTGWFSLRADAALVQKNWRYDRDNYSVTFVYTDATNTYFSLPVTAVVSLGRTFRLCGFFGGYVGYWLSGNRAGKGYSVSYMVEQNEDYTLFDEPYQFNDTRDNRFDAGLCYGTALRCRVASKFDLSAELRWYYGLTDIQKNYQTNLNPRYNTTMSVTFGLSYFL